MSNEAAPPPAPAAPADPKRRGNWVLPALLLVVYLFFKFQALGYSRQAAQLRKDLNQLRPALSAMALSHQLENTRRACQEISDQVRRLDLQNSRLLEQLSKLPASITLERVENRAHLKGSLQPAPHLQTDLRIQGTLLSGVRDPESVLVRWAQALQSDGMSVQIQRLVPSPQDPALWSFELYLEGD